MSGLHVVFGAGQVGAGLAAALAARGARVRVVRRGAGEVPGVEVVRADARDRAAAVAASAGAAVIYHCMNPSTYDSGAWEQDFPAFGEALIAAAVTHRARLVCLDNLYAYGAHDGPRREDSALAAEGRKGRVRAAWDARLRAAAAQEGLRFSVGRAGDFFGPGAGAHSFLSAARLAGYAEGGTFWAFGDADATHAFAYVPDVVAGLAALGLAGPDVDGEVFHLPAIQVSPRALAEQLAGPRAGRVRALPGWLVRGLAWVVPLFRELSETLYQWERPFLVADHKFRARFPEVGTALTDCRA